MKKIILLSGLLAFSAQAEDVAVSGKDAYAGFYAGLGICYMHSDNELKIMDGMADGDAVIADKIHSKKSHHFGGSIVAGYGCFVYNNIYLGGEALFDITTNRNINGNYVMRDVTRASMQAVYHSKVNGFVPSIAVRIGGWCCPIDTMIYVKAGIALIQAEYQELTQTFANNKRKMSKITPVVGLGIEKNVYGNLNIRLEGDYKFRVKKTTKTSDGNAIWWNIRNRVSSFDVRLMVAYKF